MKRIVETALNLTASTTEIRWTNHREHSLQTPCPLATIDLVFMPRFYSDNPCRIALVTSLEYARHLREWLPPFDQSELPSEQVPGGDSPD